MVIYKPSLADRFVLRSAADVDALLHLGVSRIRSISIDDGQISAERRVSLETNYTRLVSACGCELGSIFMGTSTVFYVLLVLFRASVESWRDAILIWLSLVFGAGTAGKLLGILLARLRLRILLTKLRDEIAMRPGI